MLLAEWAGLGARGLREFPPIMMRLCGIGTRLFPRRHWVRGAAINQLCAGTLKVTARSDPSPKGGTDG
jgi:hypothetical protein